MDGGWQTLGGGCEIKAADNKEEEAGRFSHLLSFSVARILWVNGGGEIFGQLVGSGCDGSSRHFINQKLKKHFYFCARDTGEAGKKP